MEYMTLRSTFEYTALNFSHIIFRSSLLMILLNKLLLTLL